MILSFLDKRIYTCDVASDYREKTDFEKILSFLLQFFKLCFIMYLPLTVPFTEKHLP